MRSTMIFIMFFAIFTLLYSIQSKADTKQNIAKQISTIAQTAGLDPDLAVAIATVESGLNPKAIGGLGEIGLFQLRPEYHSTMVGVPKHNMLIGIAYLLELKTKYSSKYGEAWFVLYNYGPYKAPKNPRETQYYKRVMVEVNKLRVKRFLAAR